jgi:hypothetical protein
MKKYKLSECLNYPDTPTIIPEKKRVIVFGDIHGDYDLAIDLLKLAKVIEIKNDKIEWIGFDTVVIQIGDQIDSCRPNNNKKCSDIDATYNDEPLDIKILLLFTELDILARKHGGMVISLLGNHELMNAQGDTRYVSYRNIEDVGGKEERHKLFSPGNSIGVMLGCTRKSAVIIGSNLFVHAGIINGLIKELNISDATNLEDINNKVKNWFLGLIKIDEMKTIFSTSDNGMFWTRILGNIKPNIDYSNSICIDNLSYVLELFNIDNIIIGHTPQAFIYNSGINSTCSNKIWRVDHGCSKAFNFFDSDFINTGIKNKNREVQILEIINNTQFNIIKKN